VLHFPPVAGCDEALGVSEEIAAKFLQNDAFTLTEQTRFVSALQAVKAKGLADYVDAAHEAKTPREALFFVESAEMLKRQHGEGAVHSVLTDSRAMVGLSGGRAVALLPLDYLARPGSGAGRSFPLSASAARAARGSLAPRPRRLRPPPTSRAPP
jgi:hypothetical protein